MRRQSGANTIAVIDGGQGERCERVQAVLPADVKLLVIQDQSVYIENALHEINVHLILGSILASLVVLAFMRNARSTLIAAVAIPASLVATFGMMRAFGFTLNSVTMLALVLMVGIVIDDAIVVLENIFRFVEEKKMNAFEAARAATADIGLAVLATTFSLVVIFLPVSFMSSISGRFLYQFGITASAAILVSLLVSFTLTPMMSARLLEGHVAHGERPGDEAGSRRGFYHWIDERYARLLRLEHGAPQAGGAARRRWSRSRRFLIFPFVRQEFIPGNVDEAEFEVNVNAPEGTSLAAMDEAMRAVEPEIRQTRGVTSVLTSAGGGFVGGVNQGEVFVRIEAARGARLRLRRGSGTRRGTSRPGAPSTATTASAT